VPGWHPTYPPPRSRATRAEPPRRPRRAPIPPGTYPHASVTPQHAERARERASGRVGHLLRRSKWVQQQAFEGFEPCVVLTAAPGVERALVGTRGVPLGSGHVGACTHLFTPSPRHRLCQLHAAPLAGENKARFLTSPRLFSFASRKSRFCARRSAAPLIYRSSGLDGSASRPSYTLRALVAACASRAS
jgi:hypothetical protein